MEICRGAAMRRLLLPAVALGIGLAVSAAPASADVRAFRTSDGSEDAAFVRLGSKSLPSAVVPDGAHGAYLIGRIVVNGGERQVVHLLPDGSVDPAFRLVVKGGRVFTLAVSGRRLAIAGSFTAIGEVPRNGVAVLDARSARLLAWTPAVPAGDRVGVTSRAVFSGSSLFLSTQAGLSAWRRGASAPSWTRSQTASVVSWHGALWASGLTRTHNLALLAIDPETGRSRVVSNFQPSSLETVGGRLLGVARGVVYEISESPLAVRQSECGQTGGDRSTVVNAIAGDGKTLYAGLAPIYIDGPGTLPGIAACPFAGTATGFHPPALVYTSHGPFVESLALVGDHVLVFTKPF